MESNGTETSMKGQDLYLEHDEAKFLNACLSYSINKSCEKKTDSIMLFEIGYWQQNRVEHTCLLNKTVQVHWEL